MTDISEITAAPALTPTPAEDLRPGIPPLPPRRGAMRWITTAGIATVAALAKMTVGAKPAAAACGGNGVQYSPCCDLAFWTKCADNGNKCYYTCPSGLHKEYWYCYCGSAVVGCGECVISTSHSCESGYRSCSTWWYDNRC